MTQAPPPTQPRTLIVYAHPASHEARVNPAFRVAAQRLPNLTIHDLYARYPNWFIDVAHEQALLAQFEVIVLQHPMYWYSMPALLKEWIDSVLTYGWAYGPGATKLVGKTWAHAFSTGGPAASYTHDGLNRYTIEEFIRPFEQTAYLCGMRWQSPFVAFGARSLSDESLAQEAQRYAAWLQALAAQSTGANSGKQEGA